MELKKIQRLFAVVIPMLWMVSAKRSRIVYCGACLGLVEEMNWGVGTTDSRKTIQVGSFRIDSNGKQNLNKVPLKRSEVYIMELLEMACIEVGKYSMSRNHRKNTSNFIRPDARDGTRVSEKTVVKDDHMEKTLRFACDTIVEEHEEEIIKMFRNDDQNIGTKLCVDLAGMCFPNNVTEQKEAMNEAIAETVREEAERKAAENAAEAAGAGDAGDSEDDEEQDDEEEDEEESDVDDDDADADTDSDSQEDQKDEL